MKKWRCVVCDYVHQGWKPPSHCPICGMQADMFEEVKEAENKDVKKLTEEPEDRRQVSER